VIALPPVAGATNVTVMVVPKAEIVGCAGAVGTVAGIVVAETVESEPAPSALVACTTHV
jgi:hypothetical protein